MNLPPLREVIAAHGLSASKALGQNFLLDEQLLARIAAIPGDLTDRAVLEIGPGPGGLTRALLRAGARVTAIEMDRRCLPALAELAEAFPGKLRVIEGDALKLDHDELMGESYAVAANLPYNVGTALFTRWLSGEDWPPRWTSLTLMFQQEVAQRIVAAPGSGAYGRLAVLAQWRARERVRRAWVRAQLTAATASAISAAALSGECVIESVRQQENCRATPSRACARSERPSPSSSAARANVGAMRSATISPVGPWCSASRRTQAAISALRAYQA